MGDFIRESAAIGELTGSRMTITLITPGWGSSGYYNPSVLEQAANDRVFPSGTQMHIDHDGELARFEQPAGSLTRLAAGLLEDARWEPEWVDPDTGKKGRLAAETKVFDTGWRALLKDAKDFIGASIKAGATVKDGEAEGRKGKIVESLYPNQLNRVDFVTVAGRGGRISEVLESANLDTAVEATANETARMLRESLRALYGGDDTWLWLRDHDDTRCWFDIESAESNHVYEQTYTSTDSTVTLTGERQEVRATTTYVPVTAVPETAAAAEHAAPQESSPIPAEVKEKAKSKETSNMAEIMVEETRLRTLEDSHGRVPALEADLTRSKDENTELREGLARARALNRAQEFAKTIVSSANADLSESVVARIVAASVTETSLPLTENLQLDTDVLTETVNTARESEETYLAKLAKENGLGQVRGIGAAEVVESKTYSDDDVVGAL